MTKSALALSVVAFVSLPLTARANVITGVLHFTGTVNISLGSIAFVGNAFSINSPANTQQGGFTALAGTTGTIQNITTPPDSVGPLNVPGFITFSAAPNISITLTNLLAGSDGAAGCSASPPAAGQVCTPNLPAQSPYNLDNTSATSSTASFNVLGVEVDSGTGNTVLVVGAFSTPVSNLNFQQLLAIVNGGGTVTLPFSAEFSTTIQSGTISADAPFQVKYAANLNIGESYIDIANTGANGASLQGPGFGAAAGNICVNVYTFDAGEELVSCCSCLVTPDQTVNLGVNRDLTVKTLTGVVPSSVTIKLLSTLAGGDGTGTSCANSAATVTTATLGPGLSALGTTLHADPTASYDTTETPFTPSTLSPGELASVGGRCGSILGNGSGFGVCSSCRAGALGATKLNQ